MPSAGSAQRAKPRPYHQRVGIRAAGAAAPDDNFIQAVPCGLVEPANEGGHDVAVVRVEVISGPIEVGWHDRAVVDTVLPVVALTELDAGNFCNGVGLICRLQGAREQGVLAHWLGNSLGVNARRAQLQQLCDTGIEGLMYHVALDHQVLVDELRGVGVIGMYAANFCRGENNHVWPLRLHETADGQLVSQIQLGMSAGDNVCLASCPKLPGNRAAHHAAVPSDVILGHCVSLSSRVRLEVPVHALLKVSSGALPCGPRRPSPRTFPVQ